MVALHCAVPDAVPDPPVLVNQVTEVTPTLSVAVPLKAIDDADVDTEVDEGVIIVSDGGVVLPPMLVVVVVVVVVVAVVVGVVVVGVVVGVVETAVRVTVENCETLVNPSVDLTVIVFDPIASGRFAMLHAVPLTCAVPEAG